ncbi:MAG: GFA family protein [Woeseiaceae bacterium]
MTSKSANTIERRGHCLCGKVNIMAKNASSDVGACHCKMCRRWGGGPFMEIDCGTDVEFDGEDYVSVFDSSDWAERGFCHNCGTHLFYRLKQSGQHMIPVGL